MKHGTIIASEELFGNYCWPSVTRLKNGKLVMVCSGRRLAHVCPFGTVVASESWDEGKTWSTPRSVLYTPLDDRDAGITPFGDGFMLTSFNNTRELQRRYMEGGKYITPEMRKIIEERLEAITDAEEEEHLGSLYVYFDRNYNEQWRGKLPISSPHGFTLLNDGSLMYVGRRYPYGKDGANADIEAYPDEGIGILTSRDGKTFSKVKWLELPQKELDAGALFCEPHAVQLKNGRIVIHIRVQGMGKSSHEFTIYQCISDDGGETFTIPQPLPVPEGNMCGSPPHLLETKDGTLVLVYGYRLAPYGQRARISRDGGDSWSKEIILRDDAPTWDLGYPATVECEDGLLTVYYQAPVGKANRGILYTKWNLEEVL